MLFNEAIDNAIDRAHSTDRMENSIALDGSLVSVILLTSGGGLDIALHCTHCKMLSVSSDKSFLL